MKILHEMKWYRKTWPFSAIRREGNATTPDTVCYVCLDTCGPSTCGRTRQSTGTVQHTPRCRGGIHQTWRVLISPLYSPSYECIWVYAVLHTEEPLSVITGELPLLSWWQWSVIVPTSDFQHQHTGAHVGHSAPTGAGTIHFKWQHTVTTHTTNLQTEATLPIILLSVISSQHLQFSKGLAL